MALNKPMLAAGMCLLVALCLAQTREEFLMVATNSNATGINNGTFGNGTFGNGTFANGTFANGTLFMANATTNGTANATAGMRGEHVRVHDVDCETCRIGIGV